MLAAAHSEFEGTVTPARSRPGRGSVGVRQNLTKAQCFPSLCCINRQPLLRDTEG